MYQIYLYINKKTPQNQIPIFETGSRPSLVSIDIISYTLRCTLHWIVQLYLPSCVQMRKYRPCSTPQAQAARTTLAVIYYEVK